MNTINSSCTVSASNSNEEHSEEYSASNPSRPIHKDEIQFKILIAKRSSINKKIKLLLGFDKPSPKSRDLIQQQFDLYEQIQDKITEFIIVNQFKDDDAEHYAEMYDKFLSLFVSLPEEKKQEVLQNTSPIKNSFSLPLPRINIAKFDGNITKWSEWYNSFHSIIHLNTNLSSVEKFQYLRTYLTDSASKLIENIPLSSEGYELAFKQLTDRYSNPRILCSHLIDKIIDCESISKPDYNSIRQFLDNSVSAIEALKQQNLEDPFDFMLLSILLKKLDSKTRFEYEVTLSNSEIPTTESLTKFLTNKSRMFELVSPQHSSPSKVDVNSSQDRKNVHRSDKRNNNSSLITSTQNKSESNKLQRKISECFVCSDTKHIIYNCPRLLSMSINDRYDVIKKCKLCFACLAKHNRAECKSLKTCKSCNSKKHHSLLHHEKPSNESEQHNNRIQLSADSDFTEKTSLHNSLNSNESCCLLGTANVIIHDVFNRPHTARAILDSGSQVNIISKNLMDKLNLKPMYSKQKIYGLGSTISNSYGEVNISISSPIHRNINMKTSAIVLNTITCNQPTVSLDPKQFAHFQNLKLADEEFFNSRSIDILIGADLFLEIICNSSSDITLKFKNSPSAISTVFGYVIIGSTNSDNENQFSTSLLTVVEPINEILMKFWELEEINTPDVVNPSHEYCESLYNKTTTRLPTGQYEVALPFKTDKVELGNNRLSSQRKFFSLEKRLSADESMRKQYHEFMQKYIELCHMSKALSSSTYVIPHHCVLKLDSSTTKLRVVFNASAPCNDGNILNDILHIGPKLQNELFQILLRFRTHKIAVTSDVKMMYRMISVRKEDRQYQHIFYRPSPNEELIEYELNCVTYGMTSSSYLAQRTMIQLAKDHKEDFPLASQAVERDAYVDDIVTGASSVSEAKILISQLNELMSKGQMQLRKWASNNSEVIENFPDEFLENPLIFSDDSQCIKVLGFHWTPSTDTFSYSVTSFNDVPTKRSILSFVAKLFDPLGLLAPVVFTFKYFLKLLWLANLDWDDPLNEDLSHQWKIISSSFTELSNIQIPRHIDLTYISVSLIGFCDASEKGYGACIYIHVSSNENFVSMNLVMAKTRIAPVKVNTIPKLELCGALLLAKLQKAVLGTFSNRVARIFLYTDAKLVLTWLKIPAYKLKIFVSNRVTQILELSKPEHWFHVSTKDNPADIASRGISSKEIVQCELWWNGPKSFHVTTNEFPVSKVEFVDDKSELKTQKSILLTVVPEKSHLLESIEKYSNLHKLVRVIAYCLRFINNCKKTRHNYNLRRRATNIQPSTTVSSISISEYRHSLCVIVNITQQFHFNETIGLIVNKKVLPTSLSSLAPFLDENGLIRVGGRLGKAELNFDSRHPILLPKDCHLSVLICRQTHTDNMHVGSCTTLALVRQKYWIISARSLIKKCIHQCVRCTRMNATPQQPVMADLPEFRVKQSAAFTHVGVDMAGPFITKSSPIKNAKQYKGYLALFICLTVKAVHLEYVSELTTAAFLAAFDRFVSRKGLPANMYSDNGLNFVGASRHLTEVVKFFEENRDEIDNWFVKHEIKWHFTPANSPTFGGIWESNIKSAKNLIKNQIGESPLTMEEYGTIFARVEAILNSRPLLNLSCDPNENSPYLTPSHFVSARPLLQVPDFPLDEKSSLTVRWTHLKQLVQGFWKRWSTEYLHTMTQRNKWKKSTENIEPGQLVLVQNMNTSPCVWPLARVEATHPGDDKVTRVVSLRTSNGVIIKRAVNRVIVLPID